MDNSPYKVISTFTTSKVLGNRKRVIQFYMHTYFHHHTYSEHSNKKEDTVAKIIQNIVYVALLIVYVCLLSYRVVEEECDKVMHHDNSCTTSKRTKSNVDKQWSVLFRFNGIPITNFQTFPFSLNPYVNEIVKDHKSPEELMRYEWSRYLSFKTFPQESVMTPMRLSQAGFYYTGRREEVKCFCCGLTNGDWRTGETAIEVHKRLSPSCKFICSENTDNVEIHIKEYYNGMFDITSNRRGARGSISEVGASGGPADTVGQPSSEETNRSNARTEQNAGNKNGRQAKPEQRQRESIKQAPVNNSETIVNMKHPDYAGLEARIASFATWTQLNIQVPVELAQAGFFYTGVQDFVRCYCCGVGLKNWESGDKPWVEHARWSHSCRHLLNSRGARGSSDDAPTRGQSDESGSVGSPEKEPSKHTESQRNAGACGSGIATGGSGTSKNEDVNGPDKNTGASGSADMDIPAVRSLLEMGYKQGQVLEAIQIFRQTNNSNQMTATALVELLENAPRSSEAASTAPASTSPSPSMSQSATKPSTTNKEKESIVPGGKQSPKRNLGTCAGDAKSLIKENQSLRSQLQCKICMDKDANVVFLPCGHMVACQECAVALRKCAICRKLIKGTVKVYQS